MWYRGLQLIVIGIFVAGAVAVPSPAWAVVSGEVVITEGAQAVGEATLTFVDDEGNEVGKSEEDTDDRGGAIVIFDDDARGKTVTVVVTKKDDTRTEIAGFVVPQSDWGQIQVDMASREITVTEPRPRPFLAGLSIEPLVGVEWAEVPTVGIGTNNALGSEEVFLGESPDDVTVYGTGVKLSYEFDPDGPLANTRVGFNYYWGWGDADNSAIERPGGKFTAIQYLDFAPNGSTGVGLLDGGLSAKQKVEFDYHRFVLGLKRDYPVNDGFTLTPSFRLTYSGQEQNHTGVLQSLTSDVRSVTNQEVEEDLYGVGIGAYASYPVTPMVRAGFGVSFDVFYREADLRSRQQNTCGFCPPPENDFTINSRDSDEGLTWGVDLAAGVEIEDVLPGMSVYIRGIGSYIDERAKIRNPIGGELFVGGRPTHLEDESAWDARVLLGLQYKF